MSLEGKDRFKKEWFVKKLEDIVNGNEYWLFEIIFYNLDKEEGRDSFL